MASNYEINVYHTNWSMYQRNFQVKDLDVDKIDTISYAFMNITLNNDGHYIISSGDAWADFDRRFIESNLSVPPTDNYQDNTGPFGNIGQFTKLKKMGKKFRLHLALGGWTWSANFSDAVLTQKTREVFVQSIVTFLKTYSVFDGVSIDWEYISNDGLNHGNNGNKSRKEDGDNYEAFLKLLRQSLNVIDKSHYAITMCISADPKKLKVLPIEKLDQYIDQFEMMTYDFSDGAWGDAISTHHTNLKKTSYTPFSIEEAVDAVLNRKISPKKILIGIAGYSRGFSNTDGLGKKCDGRSQDSSWEAGIVDYKKLPITGAVEYWDDKAKSTYSYDAKRRILNSYDSVQSVKEKAAYVKNKGLKGVIMWESSNDYPTNHPRSLINTLYQVFSMPIDKPHSNQPPPVISIPSGSKTEWTTKMPYSKGQVITFNKNHYICTKNHISTEQFDGSFWSRI